MGVRVSKSDDKVHLRSALRARREALTVKQAREASRQSAAVAWRLSELRRAHTLALYAPFRGELDPLVWLDCAPARARQVVLPRTHRRPPRLSFHRVSSPTVGLGAPGASERIKKRLHRGAYGILEPTGPEIELQWLDLVVVPALAYDRQGRRLGYGGGYYDRTLAGLRRLRPLCVVGVGYDWQLVDELPSEPHDQPVDMIVTPSRVVRVTRASADAEATSQRRAALA